MSTKQPSSSTKQIAASKKTSSSKIAVHPVKVRFELAKPSDPLVPVDAANEQAKSFLVASGRRIIGPHPTIAPGTYFASRHDLINSGVFGAFNSGVYTYKKTVLSLLRGRFDQSGPVREKGVVPYEMSGGRLSAYGKDPTHSPANRALRRAIKKKTPIRLTMALLTSAEEAAAPKGAKFRFLGVYAARRMSGRRTANGRRVILLKPLQRNLPSSSLWRFEMPSYFWQGRICPRCCSFLSAHSDSSAPELHRANCVKPALPKCLLKGTEGGKFHRLSSGSYLYFAQNFIPPKFADEIFCHLMNNTQFEYRVYNGTSPENKLTAHVGEQGTLYTYARSPRVAAGWGALEPYLCEILNQIGRHFVWFILPSLRAIFDSPASFSYLIDEIRIARETYANVLRRFEPNFCLMNLYCGGHHKMNWHQDNETVLDQYCVVSLSFGQTREFRIRRSKKFKERSASPSPETTYKIPLGHGSVLVMMGSHFQKDYEHCLAAANDPNGLLGPRLNLTFRVINSQQQQQQDTKKRKQKN